MTKAQLEEEVRTLRNVLSLYGIEERNGTDSRQFPHRGVVINSHIGLTLVLGDRVWSKPYGGRD